MASGARKSLNRTILAAGCLLLLIAAVAVWLALNQERSRSEPMRADAGPVGRGELIGLLGQVAKADPSKMSVKEMEQLANEMNAQIRANPLPENDDLQFSGELVIRYLRTLAAMQNYRVLKLRTGGFDPLDPKGQHPNKEAIAQCASYSNWLPRRAAKLRQALIDLPTSDGGPGTSKR